MTNTVTVTREQCIQALLTEPIGAFGDFIDSDNIADPGCKVCAVGAIFHAALGATELRRFNALATLNCENALDATILNAETFEDAKEAAVLELAAGSGNSLSVLSSLYEWHRGPVYDEDYVFSPKIPIENIRQRLVAFVERYFPTQLQLELP